jgi:hypothetical protein
MTIFAVLANMRLRLTHLFVVLELAWGLTGHLNIRCRATPWRYTGLCLSLVFWLLCFLLKEPHQQLTKALECALLHIRAGLALREGATGIGLGKLLTDVLRDANIGVAAGRRPHGAALGFTLWRVGRHASL